MCLVAGYIGSVRQWLFFEDHWGRVLEKYDVVDFHSKDFFATDKDGKLVGTYKSRSEGARKSYGEWPTPKVHAFLGNLLGVIDARNVSPIGAAVDPAAFHALTYGERRLLTGGVLMDPARSKWSGTGAPSKPYFVAYNHCLFEATQKTKPGKKTLFVFDQQKAYESLAVQTFAELARMLDLHQPSLARRFGGVHFATRHEVCGLQAADLFVHCWQRYLTDPERPSELRLDVLGVLTRKAPKILFYDTECLAYFLGQFGAEYLAHLRSTPARP